MALEVSFPALLAVLECVNLRKNIVVARACDRGSI